MLLISCDRKSDFPPPPDPAFAVLTTSRSDGPPVVLKVKKKTGQAWYRKSVDNGYLWDEIKDLAPSPLPVSDYQF